MSVLSAILPFSIKESLLQLRSSYLVVENAGCKNTWATESYVTLRAQQAKAMVTLVMVACDALLWVIDKKEAFWW